MFFKLLLMQVTSFRRSTSVQTQTRSSICYLCLGDSYYNCFDRCVLIPRCFWM